MTELRERYPHAGSGWRRKFGVKLPAVSTSASAWTDGRLLVISSLENAEYPDGNGAGPQWHISISEFGKRPTLKLARRALKAFGLEGAEEDNHEPGAAKHFWCPVAPEHRGDCECKVNEVTVVEADGHRWSNSAEPAECRGCAFERLTGNPCSIHGARPTSSRVLGCPVADNPSPARGAATPGSLEEAETGNVTKPQRDPGGAPASALQARDLNPYPARRSPMRFALALGALVSLAGESRR